MLNNDVIRINGYKDNKRTHVDIIVKMDLVEFYNSEGKKFSIRAPREPFDIAETGFNNGLDAVTSYNIWCWVSNRRITSKIV